MKPEYISNPDWELLNKKYENKMDWVLEKLNSGYPVQYLIGNVDFYGVNINVDKRALIPRFETEGLVDLTIKYIKERFNRKVNIIDLGTGSGCIAISIKKNVDSNVTAMDISEDALNLAIENAEKNNAEINFRKEDMTKPLEENYDVIISNPPYIKKDGFIQDIVKNNEPNIALFADDEGLYFYKKIINNNLNKLNQSGFMAFEIGDDEEESLKKYLSEYKNIKYEFLKDLQGLTRYLFIFIE